MNEALVLVAKLGRTVGVQGFVRLHNLSDFPEQFECGASFFDKNSRVLKIKARNAQSVLFEGFESLESAKTLVNLELFQSVEKSRVSCKLGDDEFFYFDIIGLEVFENGLLLGVVKDILPAGNDLLLIKSDESLVKKGLRANFTCLMWIFMSKAWSWAQRTAKRVWIYKAQTQKTKIRKA